MFSGIYTEDKVNKAIIIIAILYIIGYIIYKIWF